MKVAATVERSSSLRKLVLRCNLITEVSIKALAASIAKSTSLQELDLYDNQITDDGTIALAAALEICQTLTLLNLSKNRINNTGAIALATAIEKHSALQKLQIYHNQIADDGAIALAAAVKKSHALQELSLGFNKITDHGARILMNAFKDARMSMLYLSLSYNPGFLSTERDYIQYRQDRDRIRAEITKPLLTLYSSLTARKSKDQRQQTPIERLLSGDGDNSIIIRTLSMLGYAIPPTSVIATATSLKKKP